MTSAKRPRIQPSADQPEPEQEPPAPLPLHYYLQRGIVPMLASSPEERFNWHSTTNITITKRHAASKTLIAALKSLIRSGRKYRGSTPGTTIGQSDERAVRYEYWPVFDEHVDEDEWRPSWPKQRTPLGKPLTTKMVRELSEYYCE